MPNEKDLAKRLAIELKPLIESTKQEWVADAVEKTLIRIGIDASKPLEMQQDFAYMRYARLEKEDIKKRVTGELVRYGAAGVIAYLAIVWSGIKNIGN